MLAGNNPQGQQWLQGRQQQKQNNIFNGFAPQILAQAFKISVETAQKLQNQQVNRGNIVKVQGQFGVIRPPLRQGQGGQQPQEEGNGLEETLCTMRCTENLDDPSSADVYKPSLGYISTLNSYNLPILRFLRLSALRGSIHNVTSTKLLFKFVLTFFFQKIINFTIWMNNGRTLWCCRNGT